MSDSFFGFPTSGGDKSVEPMDENDYDALNYETFGDMDEPAADWEEMHEQMALQIKNDNENEEQTDELGDRLANLTMTCVFDDDREEEQENNQEEKTTTFPANFQKPYNSRCDLVAAPSNWTNGAGANHMTTNQQQNMSHGEPWTTRPLHTQTPTPYRHHVPVQPVQPLRMPAKILTVAELESQLPLMPRTDVGAERTDGVRDRDLAHMPNGRGGGGAIPRRPRPEYSTSSPYDSPRYQHHQPNHHYAGHMHQTPFRGPIRAPTGQMYPRLFDPRLPQQNQRPIKTQRNPTNYHQGQGQHQFGRLPPLHPKDDYSGLMSPQEKHWLASIQMMQLNSNQAFQDDYYYTLYQQRHGSSRKVVGATHNQKREPLLPKPVSTYKPQQFENSLGKLQIGSVTAPRKIIDMVHVESHDQSMKQNDRKTKEILLEIEQGMLYVLKIEDASNPLNNEASSIDVPLLQEKLLNMIIPKDNEGKLVQIMAIRKGKKLVLRMLPHLSMRSLHTIELLHTLMKELPAITRKDTEHNMLLFLPFIRKYLDTIDLQTLVEITTGYDNLFLLSNKFTVSVVAKLIERADQIREDCTNDQVLNEWNNFLIRLLEATRKSTEFERPVVAVDKNILIRHLTPVKEQVKPKDIVNLLHILKKESLAVTPTPASPHNN